MAAKEIAKHPIFRQYDADDVIEIVLTDGNGDEIAVVPGNRSETEIKRASQENRHYGPVNLLARLTNGTTNGPVQISVPAPRVAAESVFKRSQLKPGHLVSFNTPDPEKNTREDEEMPPPPKNQRTVEMTESPSLALDSMQRLDRLATPPQVHAPA